MPTDHIQIATHRNSPAVAPTKLPAAANFHLYKPCNLACRFCFATFRDVRGRLPTAEALQLITELAAAGVDKLTFVGGEPTLHPDIAALLQHAKDLGLVTCLVTNGARLGLLLDTCASAIDWVGLSVDSSSESVQAALGRGTGDHVRRSLAFAARCHDLGIGLKLNSVITAMNWHEDMSALVRELRPHRWKAFQVLPIDGQNDGSVEPLLITGRAFHAFVARHSHLAYEGLAPIAEDNDAMSGTYAMIDPLGRFFDNTTGRLVYSAPILNTGVAEAFKQVSFSPAGWKARGGLYDWRNPTSMP